MTGVFLGRDVRTCVSDANLELVHASLLEVELRSNTQLTGSALHEHFRCGVRVEDGVGERRRLVAVDVRSGNLQEPSVRNLCEWNMAEC